MTTPGRRAVTPVRQQMDTGFGRQVSTCFGRAMNLTYPKDRMDPPMEGWKNLYSKGRVLKISSFEGPMILRVGDNPPK